MPNPVRCLQVGRPHRGGQSIGRPVSQADGFLLIVKRKEGGDRTKDFFLVGLTRSPKPLYERRAEEKSIFASALEEDSLATAQNFTALGTCNTQMMVFR